jgi:hypothetical protein
MLFTIDNGNITIKPFDTKFNNYKAHIQGSVNLDQTMNLTVATQIPSNSFGKSATSTLASLEKAAASQGIDASVGENIDVNFVIGGTVTKPKISAQLGSTASDMLNSVKDQAKQKLAEEQARVQAQAQAKIDEAKQKAEAEVQAQKQALEAKAKAEAQKQADALKEKAGKGLQNLLKR